MLSSVVVEGDAAGRNILVTKEKKASVVGEIYLWVLGAAAAAGRYRRTCGSTSTKRKKRSGERSHPCVVCRKGSPTNQVENLVLFSWWPSKVTHAIVLCRPLQLREMFILITGESESKQSKQYRPSNTNKKPGHLPQGSTYN